METMTDIWHNNNIYYHNVLFFKNNNSQFRSFYSLQLPFSHSNYTALTPAGLVGGRKMDRGQG